MIVDADTHVLETEQTFAYLSKADEKYRPGVLRLEGQMSGDVALGNHAKDFWLIDGQLYGKHDLQKIENAAKGEIAPGTLDMRDPKDRLAATDLQGVDVAVIYTSLFLVTSIGDANAELALTKSFNRWQADVCSADPKRFKFSARDFYLKSADEMRTLWRDFPGACDNTLLIAERCEVEFNEGVMRVDVFCVKTGGTIDGELTAPLKPTTPALTPGPVAQRPLSLPNGATLPRPLFLIGADPQSRQWLEMHRERLAGIHAVSMLVNAESKADLEAMAAIARGLPILPASATDIAETLGLRHIPVLISRRGIEQ